VGGPGPQTAQAHNSEQGKKGVVGKLRQGRGGKLKNKNYGLKEGTTFTRENLSLMKELDFGGGKLNLRRKEVVAKSGTLAVAGGTSLFVQRRMGKIGGVCGLSEPGRQSTSSRTQKRPEARKSRKKKGTYKKSWKRAQGGPHLQCA